MEYFLVDLARRQDNEYCLIEHVREELGPTSAGLVFGRSVAKDHPEDAMIRMSPAYPGMQLTDIIANFALLLIASQRLKEIIEKINQGPTEYLPVSIINHKGRVASRDYFIINPLGSYDCLDLEQSEIDYHKGKVVSVDKFVISLQKASLCPHLFRVREDPHAIVMSEAIVDAIIDTMHDMDTKFVNVIIHPLEVTS